MRATFVPSPSAASLSAALYRHPAPSDQAAADGEDAPTLVTVFEAPSVTMDCSAAATLTPGICCELWFCTSQSADGYRNKTSPYSTLPPLVTHSAFSYALSVFLAARAIKGIVGIILIIG